MEIRANLQTAIPATFRIKLGTMMYALDKHIVDYCTLSIGSNNNTCVNITIPVRDKSKNMSLDHIDASSPEKPCAIDNVIIKGESTRKMLYFAATVLKTITDRNILEFTDQSSIPCNITQTEIRKIPLNLYYFMLHGKTWYDAAFDAQLVDDVDRERYELLQSRRRDPLYKPAVFNFKTEPLNDILLPIYNKTYTWEDFFKALYTEFKRDTCKMTYMWLSDAVRTLTVGGNDVFGWQNWAMDISKMPIVPYKALKVHSGGRKTRKNRNDLTMRDAIPRSEDYELFSDPNILKRTM